MKKGRKIKVKVPKRYVSFIGGDVIRQGLDLLKDKLTMANLINRSYDYLPMDDSLNRRCSVEDIQPPQHPAFALDGQTGIRFNMITDFSLKREQPVQYYVDKVIVLERGYMEYPGGPRLMKIKPITFAGMFDAWYGLLRTSQLIPVGFREGVTVDCFVIAVKVDSFLTDGNAQITLQPVGAPRFTDQAPKEPKKMKIRNKFYVAADKVTTDMEQATVADPCEGNSRWVKSTLKDAIAHANQILDKEPQRTHVAISQIVRVVRRKNTPHIVEVVR